MDCGNRNVESIFHRFGCDNSLSHQRLRNGKRLLGDYQQRHVI